MKKPITCHKIKEGYFITKNQNIVCKKGSVKLCKQNNLWQLLFLTQGKII